MHWLLAQSINVDAPRVRLQDVAGNIANFVVLIAGILSVLFVLYGAFLYVISGGNPDSTRRAKDTILYALIGVVVSGIAYAAVQFVFKKVS